MKNEKTFKGFADRIREGIVSPEDGQYGTFTVSHWDHHSSLVFISYIVVGHQSAAFGVPRFMTPGS